MQGGGGSLPLVYIPGGAGTGTVEDGTIAFQLTDDGRLILPPGLKLYTADGQEVCSTAPSDGQQERPDAADDTSDHLPSKDEYSADHRQPATSSDRDSEEC